MAKRSQKTRFGPGKDRIKPALDDEAVQSRGSASVKGPVENRQFEEQAGELATGYITEDEEQGPLTCCSKCQTVFEVSQELLSSSDTRVRCGECLGIFDALANLCDSQSLIGEASSEYSDKAPQHEIAQDKASVKKKPDIPPAAAAKAAPTSPAGHAPSGQPAKEPVWAPISVSTPIVDPADLTANVSPLDVTYADFALFSADADLPEIDYFDETRDIPPFNYDDVSELDESIDESIFSQDVVEDARSVLASDRRVKPAPAASAKAKASRVGPAKSSVTLGAITEPIGDVDEMLTSLQKQELVSVVEEEPLGAWWLRGLLFLGVLVLAAGLYGYRERDSLPHNRLIRPALESFCSVFGCTVPARVDLASLQVVKRTVFSHPDLDDTLIINVGFVNQSKYSQRYPTLEIRLTDRNGTLIVKQEYGPSSYLDNWQKGDVLDAGKKMDISLNMEDPGNKAMSFELDFK